MCWLGLQSAVLVLRHACTWSLPRPTTDPLRTLLLTLLMALLAVWALQEPAALATGLLLWAARWCRCSVLRLVATASSESEGSTANAASSPARQQLGCTGWLTALTQY